MIQSLQISRFGGPEVLKMIQQQPSTLNPDSVRIDVEAAGVNFADLMMRMGMYPEAPKPPFIPGYEVAGKVSEVGSSVTRFKPGDSVLAGSRFGGYTNEIVLPEFQVRKMPSGLSSSEAAAIPVNFMTAWVALEEMSRVRKGDRVLVQSAAGGVGVAAVQLAANAGAEVVGLVGSASKTEIVKELGAHHVALNADWEEDRDSKSALSNFDIILDATGGKSLKRSFDRLAPGGRVVNFGISSAVSGKKRSLTRIASAFANTAVFTPFKLMMHNKGVYGLNMLKVFEQTGEDPSHSIMGRAFDGVLKEFERKKLRVIVGKDFPLASGADAHAHLQSRANIGKVILRC